MLRRIRLVAATGDAVAFDYFVRNARLIAMQRVLPAYDKNVGILSMALPVVYPTGIRLSVFKAGSTSSRIYDFYLDVAENQPEPEAIVEASSTKSSLVVCNENDVVICSNGVTVTASASSPSQSATAPGEMTSEPVDGPSEMTSEPIDGPREMTSEPIDGPGEMM